MEELQGLIVSHAYLGLAKILKADRRTLRVKFLEGEKLEQTLATSNLAGTLRRHVLAVGRKCVAPEGDCTIQQAFIGPDSTPHEYLVRYADGTAERISERALSPIEDASGSGDPLSVLMNLGVQGYGLFRAREALVDTIAKMVQGGAGLRALLSSRIDLRPHQAYVSGVVLLDRRRRYILADEVGLGKTIEAGIVIHDLLIQKPEARVLVVCPGALSFQWLSEMYSKFGGNAFKVLDLHEAEAIAPAALRTAIVSTGRLLHDMEPIIRAVDWDMVVVDEAHHLLASTTLYELVQELARRTPSLLLLSALPAQRRERELISLLALLEPEYYAKESVRSRFEELYAAQQAIGRGLRVLSRRIDGYPQDFSAEDVTTAASKLLQIPVVDGDPEIANLASSLREPAAELVETARRLSHEVADRYRINRRILRNRRQHLVEQNTIAKIQRRLALVPYDPDALETEAAASMLALLRAARDGGLNEDFLLPFARVALQSLASPETLGNFLVMLTEAEPGKQINQRGRDVIANGSLSGESTNDLFLELLCLSVRSALPGEALERVVRATTAWTRSNGRLRLQSVKGLLDSQRGTKGPGAKVLVFAGYPGLASYLAAELRKTYGPQAIAEFRGDLDQEDKESNVQRFRTKDATWVMVSDESGGEGRNFQFASSLVHVDTPWHAARVEQRIGRLDRLGRERVSDEVVSHVVFAKGGIEEALVHCFDSGLRVYHASLSGLEFALREVEDMLARAVLENDAEQTVHELAPRLNGLAEEERARDDSEAVLDEASFDRSAADRFRRVANSPETEQAVEQTFLEYFRMLAPQGVHSVKDAEYSGAIWSLSPDAVLHGKVASPQGVTSSGFQGTFRREVAQIRPSLGFFTVGHPVFDAVVTSLDSQPTGRTYAVDCEVAGIEPWRGFEFVFRALPKFDEVAASPALTGQASGLFTQRPVHIFVREDGRIEEDHDWLLKSRNSLQPQSKDRTWWNLTKEKAESLRGAFGAKGWESALHDAHGVAAARSQSHFARRLQSTVDAELARIEETARQLRRSDAPEAQESERDLERLAASIREWTVQLDSAGYLNINPGSRRAR